MSDFRAAHVGDYIAWLSTWLERGGKPTHYYDYPMSRASWLVARADFTTGGECGSRATAIIVPPSIQHVGGEMGHNNLYLLHGPDQRGGWIPVYADAEFADLPGVPEFAQQAREEDREFHRVAQERRHSADLATSRSSIGRHFGRVTEKRGHRT